MSIFEKSMVAPFWLQMCYFAAVILMIGRAKRGLKIPEVQKVPGLDALEEAIGRATEMGRPVFYSPGIGAVNNSQTMASFAALGHVARRCARYDTAIIVANRIPFVQPITEEIVRQAFVQEGKPEAYVPDNVRFLSDDQFAYASGCVGLMLRDRPAANILIGGFWAESLVMAEVGSQIGAIQIAGTANTAQLPFFVAACDYCLIGDEIYAAGAYLSRDPVLMGNLIAQDWAKMLGIAIVVLGSILATLTPKANWLVDFLKK